MVVVVVFIQVNGHRARLILMVLVVAFVHEEEGAFQLDTTVLLLVMMQ